MYVDIIIYANKLHNSNEYTHFVLDCMELMTVYDEKWCELVITLRAS